MTEPIINFTRSTRSGKEENNGLSFSPDFSLIDELTESRMKAWNSWQNLPFPTDKDEDWRRTSLRELKLAQYQPVLTTFLDQSALPSHLQLSTNKEEQGGFIILAGNEAICSLEDNLENSGIIFSDFKTVMKRHPGLLSGLVAKYESEHIQKFSALTAALSKNGILLYVPKNVKVEKPLQSLTWVNGEGVLQTSHVIVVLDEGVEVTYVHETSSPAEEGKPSLHTGLFTLFAGSSSKLNFVELQSLGQKTWNLTHESILVDTDAQVDWIFGTLGSKVTKSFSNLNLVGRGAIGKMPGFYFSNGKQHLDHDTQQNHLAPNTTSDLLFKGALLGESRSVWQGMIYVDPKASKTDGYQANRNLVLSEKARADSIPGLEILTDDVRCTHGATIGKIDQDLVFYLQSRGLDRKDAEKMIVEGFFDPIMQRIPFDTIRERFQKAIEEKMASY